MTETVAIIGVGRRGRFWTDRFLSAGWKVRIFDIDAQSHWVSASGGAMTRCGTLSETVAGADWIHECLPERLALKQKVLQVVQAHCRLEAVIASDTPFLPSEIQSCASRPEQIVTVQSRDRTPVTLSASAANSAVLVALAQTRLQDLNLEFETVMDLLPATG